MALNLVAASSQRITLPTNSTLFKGWTVFSLCCWYKPVTGSDTCQIFNASKNGSPTAQRCGFVLNAGTMRIALATGDSDSLRTTTDGSGAISSGALIHIGATLDIPNLFVKWYKNGVLAYSHSVGAGAASAFDNTTADACIIGSSLAGSSAFVNGILEDLRIYSGLLSDNAMRTIYESRGRDGITENLEARWLMQDAAVGAAPASIADMGLYKRTGTPSNSPLIMPGFVAGRRRAG